MAHEYIVQHVQRQETGRAGAMSLLRLKDARKDQVATVPATFVGSVNSVNFFAEKDPIDLFNQRIVKKIQIKNCIINTKMKEEFSKESETLTIQTDFICNGSGVCIRVAYLPQISKNLYDVQQGNNKLNCIVKNTGSWLLMDNDVKQLLKNSINCLGLQQRLKDSTHKRKGCWSWKRYLMD